MARSREPEHTQLLAAVDPLAHRDRVCAHRDTAHDRGVVCSARGPRSAEQQRAGHGAPVPACHVRVGDRDRHASRSRALAVEKGSPPAVGPAEWTGTAVVVVSAVSFGTLSIFAKLAYNHGLGTEQLLAFRFALAAVGMWGLSLAAGQNPLRLSRRQAASLVAVGGVLYTLQAMT